MAHNINTEATTTRAFQRGRRRHLIKLDAQRSGPRGTHAQREEGHTRAATSSPSHTCGKKLEAFPLDQGGGEPRASSSTRHSAGSPSHGPLRPASRTGPGMEGQAWPASLEVGGGAWEFAPRGGPCAVCRLCP